MALAVIIFCRDKAYMTYFPKNERKLPVLKENYSLIFCRETIKPILRSKLIEVVLDQHHLYQHPISNSEIIEVLATEELKQLTNLRP